MHQCLIRARLIALRGECDELHLGIGPLDGQDSMVGGKLNGSNWSLVVHAKRVCFRVGLWSLDHDSSCAAGSNGEYLRPKLLTQ